MVWSEDFALGVEYHDNFARNFNDGIKYPNIRMSGLADFAHLRAVDKPVKFPEHARKFIEVERSFGSAPLTHREGNAAFVRSISEVLIVAMHASLTWGLRQEDVQQVTCPTLASLIRENEGDDRAFTVAWQDEELDNILNDVKAAVASDVLELRRFVRCGELFLLALERWGR